MNCREFQDQLDEYLEGALASTAHEAASAHLRDCARCQQRLARHHERRAALRSLAVPAPRAGFFEHALRQARRPAHARAVLWTRLAGGAVAAGLALWIGFGLLPGTGPASGTRALSTVTIALHEVSTVQLAFNAEQALSGATLSIRLPAGVEIQGFPGEREVRWKTDLARGVNLLSLPLRAIAAAEGPLQARIEHGDRSTEIRVLLLVKGPARTEIRNLAS
jgi:anti-sigma factor RsiW